MYSVLLILTFLETATSYNATFCNFQVISSRVGLITTLNYPQSQNNFNVTCTIKAPVRSSTTMRMLRLDLDNEKCQCCNFLEIHENEKSTTRLCEEEMKPFLFHAEVIKIKFSANFSRGFLLHFKVSQNSTCPFYSCVHDDVCIDNNQLCDGNFDCPDHSDEINCGYCPRNEVPCNFHEKNCYDPYLDRCDGHMHCILGEDELNCNNKCKNSIMCRDNSGCFKSNQICDMKLDCKDESDEENCLDKFCYLLPNKTKFTCKNGKCIPKMLRYNGVDNCGDGSDEKGRIDGFAIFLVVIIISVMLSISFTVLMCCWCYNRRDLRYVMANAPDFPLPPFRAPGDIEYTSSPIILEQNEEMFQAYLQARYSVGRPKRMRSRRTVKVRTTQSAHAALIRTTNCTAITLASLGISPNKCVELREICEEHSSNHFCNKSDEKVDRPEEREDSKDGERSTNAYGNNEIAYSLESGIKARPDVKKNERRNHDSVKGVDEESKKKLLHDIIFLDSPEKRHNDNYYESGSCKKQILKLDEPGCSHTGSTVYHDQIKKFQDDLHSINKSKEKNWNTRQNSRNSTSVVTIDSARKLVESMSNIDILYLDSYSSKSKHYSQPSTSRDTPGLISKSNEARPEPKRKRTRFKRRVHQMPLTNRSNLNDQSKYSDQELNDLPSSSKVTKCWSEIGRQQFYTSFLKMSLFSQSPLQDNSTKEVSSDNLTNCPTSSRRIKVLLGTSALRNRKVDAFNQRSSNKNLQDELELGSQNIKLNTQDKSKSKIVELDNADISKPNKIDIGNEKLLNRNEEFLTQKEDSADVAYRPYKEFYNYDESYIKSQELDIDNNKLKNKNVLPKYSNSVGGRQFKDERRSVSDTVLKKKLNLKNSKSEASLDVIPNTATKCLFKSNFETHESINNFPLSILAERSSEIQTSPLDLNVDLEHGITAECSNSNNKFLSGAYKTDIFNQNVLTFSKLLSDYESKHKAACEKLKNPFRTMFDGFDSEEDLSEESHIEMLYSPQVFHESSGNLKNKDFKESMQECRNTDHSHIQALCTPRVESYIDLKDMNNELGGRDINWGVNDRSSGAKVENYQHYFINIEKAGEIRKAADEQDTSRDGGHQENLINVQTNVEFNLENVKIDQTTGVNNLENVISDQTNINNFKNVKSEETNVVNIQENVNNGKTNRPVIAKNRQENLNANIKKCQSNTQNSHAISDHKSLAKVHLTTSPKKSFLSKVVDKEVLASNLFKHSKPLKTELWSLKFDKEELAEKIFRKRDLCEKVARHADSVDAFDQQDLKVDQSKIDIINNGSQESSLKVNPTATMNMEDLSGNNSTNNYSNFNMEKCDQNTSTTSFQSFHNSGAKQDNAMKNLEDCIEEGSAIRNERQSVAPQSEPPKIEWLNEKISRRGKKIFQLMSASNTKKSKSKIAEDLSRYRYEDTSRREFRRNLLHDFDKSIDSLDTNRLSTEKIDSKKCSGKSADSEFILDRPIQSVNQKNKSVDSIFRNNIGDSSSAMIMDYRSYDNVKTGSIVDFNFGIIDNSLSDNPNNRNCGSIQYVSKSRNTTDNSKSYSINTGQSGSNNDGNSYSTHNNNSGSMTSHKFINTNKNNEDAARSYTNSDFQKAVDSTNGDQNISNDKVQSLFAIETLPKSSESLNVSNSGLVCRRQSSLNSQAEECRLQNRSEICFRDFENYQNIYTRNLEPSSFGNKINSNEMLVGVFFYSDPELPNEAREEKEEFVNEDMGFMNEIGENQKQDITRQTQRSVNLRRIENQDRIEDNNGIENKDRFENNNRIENQDRFENRDRFENQNCLVHTACFDNQTYFENRPESSYNPSYNLENYVHSSKVLVDQNSTLKLTTKSSSGGRNLGESSRSLLSQEHSIFNELKRKFKQIGEQFIQRMRRSDNKLYPLQNTVGDKNDIELVEMTKSSEGKKKFQGCARNDNNRDSNMNLGNGTLEKDAHRNLESGTKRNLERGTNRNLKKNTNRGLEKDTNRDLEKDTNRDLEKDVGQILGNKESYGGPARSSKSFELDSFICSTEYNDETENSEDDRDHEDCESDDCTKYKH